MIENKAPILISEEVLLSYVSQEELASRYIQGFSKIGKSFKSRQEDISSSRLYWNSHGILMFKDFGDPYLPHALSMVGYIQYKYNLKRQEAINKIAQDFGLVGGEDGSLSRLVVSSKKKRGETPSDLVIKIKKRDWTERDIEYWSSYYIPTSMLDRNNIKSISHVFFNDYPPTQFANSHLAFSYDYYWNKGIFRRKIYQPEDREYKWRTNTDYTVVQNYPNIPKSGNLLFIQSSYKDCMVMELLGLWAIAPNKEGSWFPEYYWDKLKRRWKYIVIYWNNDWEKEINPGLMYSKAFSKQYNVPYILNPDGEPGDISDYVKKYGLEKGKWLIKQLKCNYAGT